MDPWDWRHRLVQRLQFGAPSHFRQQSRYHIELPPALLDEFSIPLEAEKLRLVLPLTTRPKEPLLGVHLEGADNAAVHLLARADIAVIQAEYLARLRDASPTPAPRLAGLDNALLEAISLVVPRIPRAYGDLHQAKVLHAYLTDGIGVSLAERDVQRWQGTLEAAAHQLAHTLGEPPSVESSSENVLLALPLLDPPPGSSAALEDRVDTYAKAVAALASAHDTELLHALALHGRRWQVLLNTELPLRRPAIVGITEDEPFRAERRGRIEVRLPLRDARSVHFEVSADDRALEITDTKIVGMDGSELPLFEGIREAREYFAAYTSNPSRPAVATAHIHLRPIADDRRHMNAALVLLASAVIAALLAKPSLGTFSLLVVPSTFVVSLLVVREPASLARQLLTNRRRLLVACAGLLWIIVLLRLILDVARPERWLWLIG